MNNVEYGDDVDDELMFICVGKRTYLELLSIARDQQQSVAQLVANALQKAVLENRAIRARDVGSPVLTRR